MLKDQVQTMLGTVFPPSCAICNDRVDTDFALCGQCWGQVPLITGPVCAKCGIPILAASEDPADTCDDCRRLARPWTNGRAVFLYRQSGRDLVLKLKHADRMDIARTVTPWLVAKAAGLYEADTVLAPVPLHWMRCVRRRYNQAALLSRSLGRALSVRHVPDLLLRPKATKPLDGVTVQERMDRLRGAIVIHPKRRAMVAGKTVLLIDDVMTSGATLGASAEACLAAGASRVNVLVLARVSKED